MFVGVGNNGGVVEIEVGVCWGFDEVLLDELEDTELDEDELVALEDEELVGPVEELVEPVVVLLLVVVVVVVDEALVVVELEPGPLQCEG